MNLQQNNLKILVIGERGVGKTSLIMGYKEEKLFQHTNSFLFPEFAAKSVKNTHVVFMEYAFYEGTMSLYYKNSDAIILVFDVTNMSSFQSIYKWINDINKYSNKFPHQLYLIGNKSDQELNREVSYEQAKEIAQSFGMQYYEVSTSFVKSAYNTFDFIVNETIKSCLRKQNK